MRSVLMPMLAAPLLASCAYLLQDEADSPSIRSVRVPPFACACPDPIVAEAVRNVFIVELTQAAEVKAVKDGPADVVLEGTITFGDAAGAGGPGGPDAGPYVSGITVLAYRGDELIASRAFGQSWNRRRLLSAENVAQITARNLAEMLHDRGMKPR